MIFCYLQGFQPTFCPLSPKNIDNNRKPIIICTFATWCKPSVVELNAISELYKDWQKETGVKIYVIVVDDNRTIARVLPFIEAKNWNYEFLWDENRNYWQALNIEVFPYTSILNGKKEIIWKRISYSLGVEEEYITVVRKLITKTK